jgi:hypothetical protein
MKLQTLFGFLREDLKRFSLENETAGVKSAFRAAKEIAPKILSRIVYSASPFFTANP